MVRPHLNSSLQDLTAIVDDPESPPELLSEVADELRHRTTKGARNLLKRLDDDPVRRTSKQRDSKPGNGRRSHHTTVQSVDSPSAFPTETQIENESARDIATQFAALRATFTAEAEILARWGLTCAMPEDIVQLVLKNWANRVTDEPDDFGRSRTSLSRDSARLSELGFWGMSEGQNTDGN